MDTFFTTLKKTLVACVFIMFGLVATYVPQPYNEIEKVHAGDANTGFQALQLVQAVFTLIEEQAINAATTLSAGYNAITSWMTNNLYIKEYVLDGIAWSIAKQARSAITQDLLNWVGTGFGGNPAFVQQLELFLRDSGNLASQDFVGELILPGSPLICEPFKTDVAVAVAVHQEQASVNQTVPNCTMEEDFVDFENYISGTQDSFGEGGWDNWFTLTSNPGVYTRYGAIEKAVISNDLIVETERQQQRDILGFGGGFHSIKTCEDVVEATGFSRSVCSINSPGKLIQEALSFNLDSDRQTLVAADELDEMIGEVLGQIANAAFSGEGGLLGLSNNPIPQASTGVSSSVIQTIVPELQQALAIERSYLEVANGYKTRLDNYANNQLNTQASRNLAAAKSAEIALKIQEINRNINTIISFQNTLNNPNLTGQQQTAILVEYSQAKADFHIESEISGSQVVWEGIFSHQLPPNVTTRNNNTVNSDGCVSFVGSINCDQSLGNTSNNGTGLNSFINNN